MSVAPQFAQPLAPSYSTQPWPGTQPPEWTGGTPLVAKVTGLATKGQTTEFTLVLKTSNTNCNTAELFLYNSEFWFAAFGSTDSSNSCCGTTAEGVSS